MIQSREAGRDEARHSPKLRAAHGVLLVHRAGLCYDTHPVAVGIWRLLLCSLPVPGMPGTDVRRRPCGTRPLDYDPCLRYRCDAARLARAATRESLPGGISHMDDGIDQAFREGMRQLGYIEGQNLVLEGRFAQGQSERLPALAAELVQLGVDVIVTISTPAAFAAKDATTTIPIVMAGVSSPVERGLVASLAQPGGNLTGVEYPGPEFGGKQLELLKEAVPDHLPRRRVLGFDVSDDLRGFEAAAQALGMTVLSVDVQKPRTLRGRLRHHAPGARRGALCDCRRPECPSLPTDSGFCDRAPAPDHVSGL